MSALCYRCGSALPAGARTCPTCGQVLEVGPGREEASTAHAPPPGLPAALGGGRYRLQGLVGRGPLGWVLRARDQVLGVEVALKVLDPGLLPTPPAQQALLEALGRQAGARPHPALARVHATGAEAGWTWLTSPLVPGTSLRALLTARLQRGGAFRLAQVERWLAAVCDGLEALGPAGPHGGLKAENVLVDGEALKLTDAGLGLALPRADLLEAARAWGPSAPLAPELAAGGRADARTDVWGLGVLLAELLTGTGPGASSAERARRSPDVDPAMEALLRRATDERPAGRPATPAAFLAELSALAERATAPPRARPAPTEPVDPSELARALGSAPPPAPPPAAPEGADTGAEAREEAAARRRFRWLVAAGMLALGVLTGVGLGLKVVPRARPLPLKGAGVDAGVR